MAYGTDQDVDQLLAKKVWAVVGLSNNAERPAYGVAKLLQEKGHKIIPVHPNAETVHGEKGYASLEEIPEKVDVVDFFLNAKAAAPMMDKALEMGIKGIWFQLEVIDEEAFARAQSQGAVMVMDRCPAIEYRKR